MVKGIIEEEEAIESRFSSSSLLSGESADRVGRKNIEGDEC